MSRNGLQSKPPFPAPLADHSRRRIGSRRRGAGQTDQLIYVGSNLGGGRLFCGLTPIAGRLAGSIMRRVTGHSEVRMSIYLLATLDTKGPEAAFVRDRLRALGVR